MFRVVMVVKNRYALVTIDIHTVVILRLKISGACFDLPTTLHRYSRRCARECGCELRKVSETGSRLHQCYLHITRPQVELETQGETNRWHGGVRKLCSEVMCAGSYGTLCS